LEIVDNFILNLVCLTLTFEEIIMADKKEILESLEKQLRSLESEIVKLKELAAKVEKGSTLIISEVENFWKMKKIF
jgi:hypothetical protein